MDRVINKARERALLHTLLILGVRIMTLTLEEMLDIMEVIEDLELVKKYRPEEIEVIVERQLPTRLEVTVRKIKKEG